MIVGLTGGIATGKSTVTNMFRELGAYVVDADVWARKVVDIGSPALQEIEGVFRQRFGVEVLSPEGTLNRAEVGKVVFSNNEARQLLNGILHPRIRQGMSAETEAFFKTHPSQPVIWDVPLLFEGETRQLVDVTVLVYVDKDVQLSRLMSRNAYTESEALARINSQMPIEEKKTMADYVIDNRGSLEQTREQVQRVWLILRELDKEGVGRPFATPE